MNERTSVAPALAMALAASALFVAYGETSLAQRTPETSAAQPGLPPLMALRVDPPTVPGGHRVQATIDLAETPGPGGIPVAVTSSNPKLTTVPATVTLTGNDAGAQVTFPIDTRAVVEDETVTITARAGNHTVEAELRLRKPAVQHASLEAPAVCDGEREGTLKYLLTGPAPEGLRVVARATVQSAAIGNSADSSGAVPVGQPEGSMRVRLPKCQKRPGERCTITGWVRIDKPAMVVDFSGSCGHSPY